MKFFFLFTVLFSAWLNYAQDPNELVQSVRLKLEKVKDYTSDVHIKALVPMIKIDEVDAKEKALKKCLDQLKDMQKACVEKFYLSKKSYLEIAAELKLNLNSVKSNIQNGKRNLKICIEGSQ